MKSIWSGVLSLGLVNIPVQVYPGTVERSPSFDYLHKTDLIPIKNIRICPNEYKKISYEDIVHGYEYKKGHYVVLEKDELKKVNIQKTKSVQIVSFTDASQIDPVYFKKPYFIGPSKGGTKGYALIREALEKTNKVAVVRFVMRNRERIGILKVENDLLILNELRYRTELRIPHIDVPRTKSLREDDIQVVTELIDTLSEKFNPRRYKDTYHEEMEQLIEQKMEGKKIAAPSEEPKPTKAPELMQRLRETLEHVRD